MKKELRDSTGTTVKTSTSFGVLLRHAKQAMRPGDTWTIVDPRWSHLPPAEITRNH